MLLDIANIYSNSQAVTATAASTDVIDHRATGDLGRTSLRLRVSVPVAFSGGTSVNVQFQTSAAENFASPTTLIESGAQAVATLTAGRVVLDVPVPSATLRYTRVNYVVVGTPTAGTFDASLVEDTPNLALYPDAVEVY